MKKLKDYWPFKNNHKRTTRKSLSGGVKVNRSIVSRSKLHKDIRARKRAEYLSTLPKNPIKRFFYRLHPKRLYKYFTSRQGLYFVLKFAGICFVLLFIIILSAFAYFRRDLPKDISDLKSCAQGASAEYYDRTGKILLWASSGNVECYPVQLNSISPNLRNAVVSVEDKNFFTEGGFSIRGTIRAALNDAEGNSTQGGSTITQQFVKNSILTSQQTISRKVKELILAVEVNDKFSKNDILDAYLNDIPFGSVYDGVQAAAEGYFGTSASNLTLAESATLAAMIPAPSYYSPYGTNTADLISREHYVLDQMQKQGYITQAQETAAENENVLAEVIPQDNNAYKGITAPWFVLEVQTLLEQKYGAVNVQKGGFKVITTLNVADENYAEQAIADNMYKDESDGGDNAALVSIDVATSQVIAEVGSRGFDYPGFGQINMAVTPRSPGSSFKIYDYAALMQDTDNFGAGSIIYDLKTTFTNGYQPSDYDFLWQGAISMRYALGGSRNIPAIKAMYIVGTNKVMTMAHKMGVVSGTSCEPNCGLSSAIGDGSEIRLDEHTNGYTTLARMGVYKPLTYILQVQSPTGQTLYQWKDTAGTQVVDPQVAYIINNMLSDDKARYIRGSSNFNLPGIVTALKTGTTNNMENGWLEMYSTKIATGVWVGNHANTAMWCGVYGCEEGVTGPIMAEYMKDAHKGVAGADDNWVKPSGVKTVCLNQITGYATTSGGECDIFPSWYQPKYPGTTKTAVIDTISGKLANACTPNLAKESISGGGINTELPSSDPLYENFLLPEEARYGASGGNIPTDYDDVHTCGPSGTWTDSPDLPAITLSNPVSNGNNTWTVTANVTQGKYALKTVNFENSSGAVLSGGSFSITSSGAVNFTYTATTTNPITIQAQVIDSVLYDVVSNQVTITPST